MPLMVRKLGPLIYLLLAVLLCAQQRPGAAQNSSGSENRSATEPQVGYAAQNQAENTLVGCVRGANHNLLLVQQAENRIYRLKGAEAQLANDIGKLVKVTGHLAAGTGAQQSQASIQVTGVQVVEDTCRYQAKPEVVSGKTGNQGDALPVTDTSTAGQVTPGAETQAGRAQQPGKGADVTASGTPHRPNPTAAQGAPATPEQAAQNPVDAERIANAARQVEATMPQSGVTTQPNSRQQDRSRAGREKSAPTLVGCLTATGSAYSLQEQWTGKRYRVKGSQSKLKEHLDHLVQVAVRRAKGQGSVAAAASDNEEAVEVTAIQDLAPTCGAQPRR